MKKTASNKQKVEKKVYATYSEQPKRGKTSSVSVKESASTNASQDKIDAKKNDANYPFDVFDKKSPDDYKHVPGMKKEKKADVGYNPFGRFATYVPTQEIAGSFVRVDAYKEITEGSKLEGLQNTVFMDRYSMRDDKGKQLEVYPEQLWRRVARAIASAEKTDYLRKKWEDKFYSAMTDFKFVPAGRILSGSGTGALVTYYNCFVIPSPEDSRTGIIDNLKIMTEIMARSGGVGINLSTLRPRGSYIKTVNGHSSGPMAWAQLYSVATGDVISQGGSRRGALMLMLDDNHPDIEEFITVKKTQGMITHANLSVAVSDAFMEAVKNDEDWDLVWKGEVMKTVKARHIWDLICTSAWESAEPGVVFTDRYNKMSNTWYYEDIRCTNPCGEQGLGEWQVCNLGSINLASFVKDDGSFDYDELEKTTRVAMRFLDNVIDSCYYFFEENRNAQLSTRRTGLGTMGLADALIKMKLRYGSEEAIEVVEKIYALMRDAAYDESSDIALEKGSFPMFVKDKYLQGKFIQQLPTYIQEKIGKNGIRNAVLLSQAPTGTISLFAGVSSGIEPVFAFAMVRSDRTGTHTIYHPLFEEWKKSVPEDTEVPEYFASAADLTPEDHVRIQAVIQKYTDSSISKTVNAPNGYSVENVKKLYRLAYDLGCKGITFYREGSRDAVLTTLDTNKKEEKKEESPVDLKKREDLLTGVTYKTHTPVGTAYITINSDSEGNIFEVFINVGKAGSDIYADATALGRLISLMFQVPSTLPSSQLVDHVINRLEDIGGASSTGFGAKRVRSLADAVAKVIAQHVGSNAIKKDLKVEQVIEEQKHGEADFCPECGQATLVKEEGCQKCYNCGFSKC